MSILQVYIKFNAHFSKENKPIKKHIIQEIIYYAKNKNYAFFFIEKKCIM